MLLWVYSISTPGKLEKFAWPTSPMLCHRIADLPSLTVYLWVSRFSRWPPGLTVGLENLTDSHKNTISENIVCSFERKSVRICKVWNKKAKMPKSPQFVVQIKVVVLYSWKIWAILAIYCSGKFFWPLKWYTDRKCFGDGGDEVADINLFPPKNFRKWSGTIRKLWTKGLNNVQVFNNLNLAALE
jgi:hypothetical protein